MKLGRFTVAGYAIALVVGVGIIATYGAMHMSSTPGFCGSCHVMSPYYESWSESTHAGINCVDCHISPGITQELRKKYEAMAMVARYFTGTYGTNPWAEVDDIACLECHERRLLAGTEIFGEVLFDHGPHLSELRRGKKLKCTSCHSQIVQGSHMTVTGTTCTLCHFKGQEAGEGTARCTLCHTVPDRVLTAGGLDFDHGDVARFGMECNTCHTPPRPDAGGVPRERCLTCHNDEKRLAEYDSGDLLHRTHVTEHKVECTHCHLEIEHVTPRHFDAAKSECASCHGGGHSPQRELYAGLGGKGVDPRPDVMYLAGVRCEGCHVNHGDGETALAGEVSCMSCHGPKYRQVYKNWQVTVAERTSGVRKQLDSTARLLGSESPAAFEDATANLRLVERGKGIHNVPYSVAVLEAAHAQINEARAEEGYAKLTTPWPTAPYASDCLACHAGVETLQLSVFGRGFAHQPHVVGQGLECQECHSTHEERDTQGMGPLKIQSSSCNSCHHSEPASDCASCHGGVMERAFSTDLGDFEHAFHVGDMEIGCTDCHGEPPALQASPDLEVCSDCH